MGAFADALMQVGQFIQAKEALIARQDFEQAAELVSQARQLNRHRRALLREHRRG